jgi:hypothetical protein
MLISRVISRFYNYFPNPKFFLTNLNTLTRHKFIKYTESVKEYNILKQHISIFKNLKQKNFEKTRFKKISLYITTLHHSISTISLYNILSNLGKLFILSFLILRKPSPKYKLKIRLKNPFNQLLFQNTNLTDISEILIKIINT